MSEKISSARERRKYIRLNTVFPVQFRVLSLDGEQPLSGWLQGFTNNIGKGGICLAVNNLNQELAQQLISRQVKLYLDMEMPISKRPIGAIAAVVWLEQIGQNPSKYLIGLNYEDIDARLGRKMLRYAWVRKLFVPATSVIIFLLGLGFLINSAANLRLNLSSKALIEEAIKIRKESYLVKGKIQEIDKERQDLQLKIQQLQAQIQALGEEKKIKEVADTDEITKLGFAIQDLVKEKNALQGQLSNLQNKENSVNEELLSLDKKKKHLEKAQLEKLYFWLKVHQNPRTGLIMSFEGDNDIANWAFIYDQSLAIQAYTYFGDFELAKKLINFFDKKAKRIDARFLNAYYASDANPAEYTVHSGPNIWLGIAILQYTHKAKDNQFLKLAEEIAQSMIYLQEQDADGGIRGGPNIEWYSTEHNLDAYAFFNMLHKMTDNPRYLRARDKALNWLVAHTYDKMDVPIKRGKGDSTIATDTYAWSIAAIGPEKLEQVGMNPDKILEFAEESCRVEVDYSRPEGAKVKVKGFDFAPQRHVARGGVVSSEWTAQMVLAFKIMANYYTRKNMADKANYYAGKAEDYLTELSKMLIASSSPSGQGGLCLPYATEDYVDTGHGWVTPKGVQTGSVSGTAYTIFAYYGYNPLELSE